MQDQLDLHPRGNARRSNAVEQEGAGTEVVGEAGDAFIGESVFGQQVGKVLISAEAIKRRVHEMAKELARDYTEIEWFRNFRLVLEKDCRILKRSLGMEKGEEKQIKLAKMRVYKLAVLLVFTLAQ